MKFSYNIVVCLYTILITTVSCNNLNSNTNNDNYVKSKFHIQVSDCLSTNDTLTIISADNVLFFPFGEYNETNKLQQFYSDNGFHMTIEIMNNDTILRFQKKSGYCKFFRTASEFDDRINYQIIYARVTDQIPLFNSNIFVGMNKVDFIEFFDTLKTAPNAPVPNYIKLVSARLGVFYLFSFKNEKLVDIRINSDYQLNKI